MLPKVKTYIENVIHSGLVAEEQLRTLLDDAPPNSWTGNGEALGQFLIERGVLTKWQQKMLLRGVRSGFFVGKHKLLGRIGAGGMSIVYLGRHVSLHRLVAIKVLDSRRVGGGPGVERFFRESRATASMDHPNVVRVYDFDTVGAHHYLVMEYIDGPNLQDLVELVGPLPLATAAHYIMQTANGLACAHAAGMVHRDVKPGNLLVNNSGQVKLSDLGLARVETADAARLTVDDGSLLGTIDYISPEQAFDSHQVGPAADIYSLGGTFYFLLTGSAPFPNGTISSKLLRHQMSSPVAIGNLRSDVTPRIEELVLCMMAKRPEERPTAEEIRNELASWVDLGMHTLLEMGGCRPDRLQSQTAGVSTDTLFGQTGSTMNGMKPAGWKPGSSVAMSNSSLDLLEPLRRAQSQQSEGKQPLARDVSLSYSKDST